MTLARGALVDAVPGSPMIVEIELADPGPGEVLIRTVSAGVCHTDLHGVHGLVAASLVPYILGHEAAGVVEQVGPGVRRVTSGDHVVVSALPYCGHCERCLRGRPYLCMVDEYARAEGEGSRIGWNGQPINQFLGVGGLASRLLVGQNAVVKIRPDMPLEFACILGCGVVTGVGAVLNTAHVEQGSSVVVVGCGGVGLAAIQGAKIAFAGSIIAVDLDDQKLDLAKRLGATHLVNAKDTDAVEFVRELTAGGADYVFEVVGTDATRRDALAMSSRGGAVVFVGMIDPAAQVTLSGAEIMAGRTISKSVFGSSRVGIDIPRLVDHFLAGRLDLESLVTARRALDDVPDVLRGLDDGNLLGRTVVTFEGE
jgi:S-(hydroxymethyl)glutathione dehydrogenase / alcohol dehydrogenase